MFYAVLVYVVTQLMGERGGIGRAFLTSIVGAIVYSIAYALLGNGLVAAIVGGIVWLIALQVLYNIGWLRSLITAVLIWIAVTIVGFVLPTLPGPV